MENSQAAEKIRRDKEKKVKNTLAQFNVSSTDVVNWTSKNPKKYQEFSKIANHDEYNTLKQVIKDIIKKRNTQKEKDEAFSKMMALSKEKARECQESDGTNKKEQRLLQIQQCHKKIETIYNMERRHLTFEQRAIFDIPISQRKHQGLEAMALWIATSTLILTTTMKSGQKTITQCIEESNNMEHEKAGRKGRKKRLKTKFNV